MPQGRLFAPGARRVARPAVVRTCDECGEPAGRGYPSCPGCAEAVDRLWSADWQALAVERGMAAESEQRQLAALVLAGPVGDHPWTCVDWAMSLLTCQECGRELGAGPIGCVRCRIADERRWAWTHEGPPGAISANEHALRAARATLRAPHRHRSTVVASWRLSLPFVLTGEVTDVVSTRWIRAYLRAGRYDELAAADSYADLVDLPGPPWRAVRR